MSTNLAETILNVTHFHWIVLRYLDGNLPPEVALTKTLIEDLVGFSISV